MFGRRLCGDFVETGVKKMSIMISFQHENMMLLFVPEGQS